MGHIAAKSPKKSSSISFSSLTKKKLCYTQKINIQHLDPKIKVGQVLASYLIRSCFQNFLVNSIIINSKTINHFFNNYIIAQSRDLTYSLRKINLYLLFFHPKILHISIPAPIFFAITMSLFCTTSLLLQIYLPYINSFTNQHQLFLEQKFYVLHIS